MDPVSVDTWLHLAVAVVGFGSIGAAQWRGSITVTNRLDNLTAQVKKTNGTLLSVAEKQHDMELFCVSNHGLPGERGERGHTGYRGDAGEKGDIGATGATGAQGEKGERGEHG